MKILVISTRIFPDAGGPAIFAFKSAKEMAIAGNSVHILSSRPPFEENEDLIQSTQNLYKHFIPITAPDINRTANIFKKGMFLFLFIILGIWRALRIVKKEKIVIIHAHTPYPSGIIGLFLKIVKKIPYTYLSHSMDYDEKINQKIELKFIQKYADQSFLIAEYIAKFLSRDHKYILMPNAINSSDFYSFKQPEERGIALKRLGLHNDLKSGDFIILYIGYMVLKQKVIGMINFAKGYFQFLNQLTENERRKIKLIFVGDGQFKHLLENSLKKMGLKDNIYLIGLNRNIPLLCAIADIGALTSYSEGMPTSLLEMMAAGLPCIATAVGEIPRILGGTGFLVKPGDSNAIATNLKELYFNKRERLNRGNLARERVNSNFSWKQVLEIYQKATRSIYSKFD